MSSTYDYLFSLLKSPGPPTALKQDMDRAGLPQAQKKPSLAGMIDPALLAIKEYSPRQPASRAEVIQDLPFVSPQLKNALTNTAKPEVKPIKRCFGVS